MNKETKDVLSQCFKRYGEVSQLCNAMEECAELIQAINKVRRKGKWDEIAFNNLIEEIADVTLLMEQLKMMYSISDLDIEKAIDYKVKRQLDRFKDEDKKFNELNTCG